MKEIKNAIMFEVDEFDKFIQEKSDGNLSVISDAEGYCFGISEEFDELETYSSIANWLNVDEVEDVIFGKSDDTQDGVVIVWVHY